MERRKSMIVPAFRVPTSLCRNLTIAYVVSAGALFGLLYGFLYALQSAYSMNGTVAGLLTSCFPFGTLCGLVLTCCFIPELKSRWVSAAVVSAGVICVLSGVVLFMPESHHVHSETRELVCEESAFQTNFSVAANPKAAVPSAGQLALAGIFLWLVGASGSVVLVLGLNQEKLSSGTSLISTALGALLGFVFASIEESDAKRLFVVGLLLCGTVQLILGLLFCIVPNTATREDSTVYQEQVPGIKINFGEVGRLLRTLSKNWMFVNFLAVILLDVFGMTYFLQSLPGYLQWQFDVSQQVATAITAASFFFPLILSVGVVPVALRAVRYSTNNTKKLTITCIAVSGLFAVLLVFISCPARKFDHEAQRKYGSALVITNLCNEKCHCSRNGEFFQPVCHQETQMTFASACHAGCLNWNSATHRFERCECVKDKLLQNQLEPTETFLTKGLCTRNCGLPFFAYITLLAFMQFFAGFPLACSLKEITRTISDYAGLQLSKKLLLLLVLLIASATPSLMGVFTDATCLLWDSHMADQRTNYRRYCVLHNADRLKPGIHIPLIFIKILLTALLYMIYRYSSDPDGDADAVPSVQYQPVTACNSVLNLVEAEETEAGAAVRPEA